MKSDIKKEKAKINYDFDNDILYVYPIKRKYDLSHQIDDFIFDIDSKGRINGIEIMNASKIFNISKVFLKDNISGKIKIIVNDFFIKIMISLEIIARNKEKEALVNIERIKPDFMKSSRLNLAIS